MYMTKLDKQYEIRAYAPPYYRISIQFVCLDMFGYAKSAKECTHKKYTTVDEHHRFHYHHGVIIIVLHLIRCPRRHKLSKYIVQYVAKVHGTRRN